MLRSSVSRVVDFCSRHAWWVIVLGVAMAAASSLYTLHHFAIKTDVKDLFPSDLPWAQRAIDYMKTFPQPGMLVVIDAPTPELADQASTRLTRALASRPDLIRAVHQLQGGPFFERNGLLYLPTDEVVGLTQGLVHAGPLLQTLAADPSLRGALNGLSLGLMGVQYGQIQLDDLARPMAMASDTAQEALAGQPASFSWRALAGGKAPEPRELRQLIEVEPVLDYTVLEPGLAATDAILQTAQDLNLDSGDQARVRLTGPVPMDDDQFATVRESAPLNIAVSIVAVLVVLWLALHSARIILAVAISLGVGLAISAAFGLFLVGALNIISVAFFVLFIGLGVDFGLQFGVRYRAERHEFGDLRPALRSASRKAGVPLALAAAATALGFSSFLPTSYQGLSELGQIAGCGMIIAFLTSITLLPALLTVLKPPGEPHPMGFASLAPVNTFVQRHRFPVVAGTLLLVALASPLLLFLRFDFNQLHVRNRDAPSVATFLDLREEAQTGTNAIGITAANQSAADAIAQRLSALPQVAQTRTLDSLVPGDQEQKVKLIQAAADQIGGSLSPQQIASPPTDAQIVEALSSTSYELSAAANVRQGSGANAARRLSGLLLQLARADSGTRQRGRGRGSGLPAALTRTAAARAQPSARDRAEHSRRSQKSVVGPRRPCAGTGTAQGRPRGYRWATRLRGRGIGGRADGDRPGGDDARGRQYRDAGLYRGRALRAGGDCSAARDHVAPSCRCPSHPAPAARRRGGDPGAVRRFRYSVEFRQYHGTAATARCRRRFQDLLHHGLA